MSPDPQPRQPPDPFIQIDVRVTLPRRLWWLLAGIAIGNFRLPNGLLEIASLVLRALITA